MKYFMDSEFLEDGKTIELMSLALVGEDGRRFYAVDQGMPMDRIRKDKWLMENVVPHLDLPLVGTWQVYADKDGIRRALLEFLKDDLNPEFWADYASYDWIVLCQLFGRMIDLPEFFPMWCRDIQQFKDFVGFTGEFETENEWPHHALYDAIECQGRYRELAKFAGVDGA